MIYPEYIGPPTPKMTFDVSICNVVVKKPIMNVQYLCDCCSVILAHIFCLWSVWEIKMHTHE